MLGLLEKLVDYICGHSHSPVEYEPAQRSCWIVDLPPRDAVRLGSFRTKDEALDARREHIIRTIKETAEPIELPF